MNGFCLRCRKQVDVKDAVKSTTARISNPVYKGPCPHCGKEIVRIGQVQR